jgi:hypothetical protein
MTEISSTHHEIQEKGDLRKIPEDHHQTTVGSNPTPALTSLILKQHKRGAESTATAEQAEELQNGPAGIGGEAFGNEVLKPFPEVS